ncbi:MAG: hypothetical protein H0V44_07680 [Planctomycetes bacterium]|nr:hypothetical protein [Planctomycetota bacterium]
MVQRKDIERVARSMHGQKLEREYIRHYLIETYQLDNALVDLVMENVGIPKPPPRGGKLGVNPQGKDGPTKKGFY